MPGCIYARTSRIEKAHDTTKIEHQVAFCRELAARRNIHIAPGLIFTDVELTGELLPTCWAPPENSGRPALSAMIEAIQAGHVKHVLVRRPDVLGTSSAVLAALLECFQFHHVSLIADRDMLPPGDLTARFAYQMLKPVVLFDSEAENARKEKERQRLQSEIQRLENRIQRMQIELANLDAAE